MLKIKVFSITVLLSLCGTGITFVMCFILQTAVTELMCASRAVSPLSSDELWHLSYFSDVL